MKCKFKDEIGNRYGRWLILTRVENDNHGNAMWLCQCDCGTKRPVKAGSLRSGRSRSCGCYGKEVRLLNEGENHNMFGKPKSEETKRKIATSLEGNIPWNKDKKCPQFSGEKSPSWNPNLTDEDRMRSRQYPEYKQWRNQVFEKDNFTCQYCGKHGVKLRAHHIEGYNNTPELRTKLSNGITFCKKHHDDFHHIYGRGNNTREQLEEFLAGRK